MTKANLLRRFWARVDKSKECWEWTGERGHDGYGRFMLNSKRVTASRWIYFQLNPTADQGKFVCHRCDNPSCVRPDHLFLSTPLGNMRDMIAKGRKRSALGEAHGRAKLTTSQVMEICSAKGERVCDLARRFKVSRSHVSNLRQGRNWRHITATQE